MPRAVTQRGSFHWMEAAPGGDAPVIVLLHGLGGDAAFWSSEQAALSRHFRVLAVDLRGSGLTVAANDPFSIEDLATDVVEVLDAARIDRAHVVGFSMGGLVAQALAACHPARVRRLVLAASFGETNPQARRYLEAVAQVYREQGSARQLYALVLPWLFSERFFGDPRAQPYLDYPEDAGGEPSREDWLRLLDAQLRYRGFARLSAILAPTLVIAGEEDRLATVGDAARLAHGIDGALLEVLPGGHLMNVESGPAFVALLERFLMP